MKNFLGLLNFLYFGGSNNHYSPVSYDDSKNGWRKWDYWWSWGGDISKTPEFFTDPKRISRIINKNNNLV
jgi:hypothetical protein